LNLHDTENLVENQIVEELERESESTNAVWITKKKKITKSIRFVPSEAEGYSCTKLSQMSQPNTRRPAYGAYSMALGDFNSSSPGDEIVAGIPRGQNKDGVVTGEVQMMLPLDLVLITFKYDNILVIRPR